MGKRRRRDGGKVVDEDPDDLEPDPVKVHFNAFFEGDNAALVPLGFAFLERNSRQNAYAAWYLAALKDVPDTVPLIVTLSQYMTKAELLAAEEEVNNLLPRIGRLHGN